MSCVQFVLQSIVCVQLVLVSGVCMQLVVGFWLNNGFKPGLARHHYNRYYSLLGEVDVPGMTVEVQLPQPGQGDVTVHHTTVIYLYYLYVCICKNATVRKTKCIFNHVYCE